jgi:hypothetical protein
MFSLVYFFGIFLPNRCGDKRGFGVHPILTNTLPQKYSTHKYSSPKILYHDEEFLI